MKASHKLGGLLSQTKYFLGLNTVFKLFKQYSKKLFNILHEFN